MRKKLIALATSCFLLVLSVLVISATENKYVSSGYSELTQDINTSTNFFTQKENTTTQEYEQLTDAEVKKKLSKDFKTVDPIENDKLKVYLNTTTLGLAIYNKETKYVWYSYYEKYKDIPYCSCGGVRYQFLQPG